MQSVARKLDGKNALRAIPVLCDGSRCPAEIRSDAIGCRLGHNNNFHNNNVLHHVIYTLFRFHPFCLCPCLASEYVQDEINVMRCILYFCSSNRDVDIHPRTSQLLVQPQVVLPRQDYGRHAVPGTLRGFVWKNNVFTCLFVQCFDAVRWVTDRKGIRPVKNPALEISKCFPLEAFWGPGLTWSNPKKKIVWLNKYRIVTLLSFWGNDSRRSSCSSVIQLIAAGFDRYGPDE